MENGPLTGAIFLCGSISAAAASSSSPAKAEASLIRSLRGREQMFFPLCLDSEHCAIRSASPLSADFVAKVRYNGPGFPGPP